MGEITCWKIRFSEILLRSKLQTYGHTIIRRSTITKYNIIKNHFFSDTIQIINTNSTQKLMCFKILSFTYDRNNECATIENLLIMYLSITYLLYILDIFYIK